ncbi:MAG: ATP-dependent DNA helicase RecQ [Bacteroidota bacterium]
MAQIHHILKQYWGYTTFRPLQEEIIQAVLAGKDVLALLPTGGGKSICFQVPALAKPGICIVVTPLIALMKDQVEQLKKRGIAAAAIFAGMKPQEIDIVLDNCIYGQLKFLYVSPERLKTELFQKRVQKMPVNLLAVDEAHCISQWGYDFRPSYLDIASLQPLVPGVNIIALTATATRAVKQDIQEKLHFRNTALFQKSFTRENLAYVVRKTEDRDRILLKILNKIHGTAIIYVNTRKKTKALANFLCKNGINASFYHAGLTNEARAQRQDAWIQDKIRVIVATNAFGMGIDKPDVRLVLHLDLPTTLEAYYQEAGRAGRDEKQAYAIVLYDEQDVAALRDSIQEAYPSVEQLKKVYQHLANYYQVAVGTHAMTTYNFDWEDFVRVCKLKPQEAYQAIKSLESEGVIQLNEAFFQPARLHISINHKELYAFQVAHASYDALIKAFLRIYGGELFADFCNISESRIAQFLHITPQGVSKQLDKLHHLSVIQYIAQKDKPQLTFITPRYAASQIPLDIKKLKQRKALATHKAEAVIHYITHQTRCRAQLLLEYFDEVSYKSCGLCDICLAKAKEQRPKGQLYQRYRQLVLQRLQEGVCEVREIVDSIDIQGEEEAVEAIRQMLENEELIYDQAGRLAQNH